MILDIDPGLLHLPPSRASGADPYRLAQQTRQFGVTATGMPMLQVTRGRDGELMINDGVTRATRLAKLNPGSTIYVEVIDERPTLVLDHLPRIRDRL